MLGHTTARGRGSGAPVESPAAFLSTLRDGRIVRVKGFLNWGFLNWDAALEAAGLSDG